MLQIFLFYDIPSLLRIYLFRIGYFTLQNTTFFESDTQKRNAYFKSQLHSIIVTIYSPLIPYFILFCLSFLLLLD